MPVTVPPPTAREARAFDALWAGRPHRNVCVRMVDGNATIHVIENGPLNVLVYRGAIPISNDVATDPATRTITITGDESDSHFTGRICLGYSEAP